MTDDLWYHALTFLEDYRTNVNEYDITELYKYADETGILERHKQLLSQPYSNKKIDMKIMYFELIKMLLDHDKRNFPESYEQAKDLHKIQGFQDLTNRLQKRLNKKYDNQIMNLNVKVNNVEQIFGDRDMSQFNFIEKLEALEQQNLLLTKALEECNRSGAKRSSEISALQEQVLVTHTNVEIIQTITTTNTTNINMIINELKAKDEIDSSTSHLRDEQQQIHRQTLEVIEKRLDTNEEHIELLKKKDDQQDLLLHEKVEVLEKADEFLRESQTQLTKKSQVVEEEQMVTNMKLKEMNSNYDELKENTEMSTQKINNTLKELMENMKNNGAVENLTMEFYETRNLLNTILEQQPMVKIGELETKVNDVLPLDIKNLSEKINANFETIEKQAQSFAEVMTKQMNDNSDKTNEVIFEIKKDMTESSKKNVDDILNNLEPEVRRNTERINELNSLHEKVSENFTKIAEERIVPLEGQFNVMSGMMTENGEKLRESILPTIAEIEKNISLFLIRFQDMGDRLDMDQSQFDKLGNEIQDIKNGCQDLQNQMGESQINSNELESKLRQSNERLEAVLEEMKKQEIKLQENLGENISIQFNSLEVQMNATNELLKAETTLNQIHSDKLKGLEPKVFDLYENIYPAVHNRLNEIEPKTNELLSKINDQDQKFTNFTDEQEWQNKRLDSLEMEAKKTEVILIDLNKTIEQGEKFMNSNKKQIDEIELDLTEILKPKLFGLEEQQIQQVEKVHYVEMLQDKVNMLDEQKQRSDAFMKESLEESVISNKVAHEQLKDALIQKMNELDENDKNHFEKISELLNKNDMLKNLLNDSLRGYDEKGDQLYQSLELRIENVGNQAGRVEQLINEVLNPELSTHSNQLADLRKENQDVRNNITLIVNEGLDGVKDDIRQKIELVNTKCHDNDQHVSELKELNAKLIEQMKEHINNEIVKQKEMIEELKNDAMIQIYEIKETLKDVHKDDFRLIKEKVSIVEGIILKIDSIEKDTTHKIQILERAVGDSDGKMTILEKDTRDYATFSRENLRSFRTDYEDNKNNLWNLITKIFGALRGCTVILKSDGPALEHQPDCFGVYRMADSFNNRPLYKQDMGENYIYYHVSLNAWMIGTRIGHNHAWMRNFAQDQFTPDDLTSGWEYLSIIDRSWETNDKTLRIETLRDIEKIKDAMHEIRIAKEID